MTILFDSTCVYNFFLFFLKDVVRYEDSLLVMFYGISTIVGYLMPNPLYRYIFNIYDLVVKVTYLGIRSAHERVWLVEWKPIWLPRAYLTRGNLEPARGNLHVCKLLRDLTIIQIRTVFLFWVHLPDEYVTSQGKRRKEGRRGPEGERGPEGRNSY